MGISSPGHPIACHRGESITETPQCAAHSLLEVFAEPTRHVPLLGISHTTMSIPGPDDSYKEASREGERALLQAGAFWAQFSCGKLSGCETGHFFWTSLNLLSFPKEAPQRVSIGSMFLCLTSPSAWPQGSRSIGFRKSPQWYIVSHQGGDLARVR